jgi:hypothetical protein
MKRAGPRGAGEGVEECGSDGPEDPVRRTSGAEEEDEGQHEEGLDRQSDQHRPHEPDQPQHLRRP